MPADFLRLSRLLDLSAESRAITNIGNSGTDFDASGGLTLAGDLTVGGNFAVSGSTFAIETTNLKIDDKNIELAHSPNDTPGNNAAVDGGGITLVSTQGNKTINWVNSTSAWTSSEHINIASGKSYYVNGTLLRQVTEILENKTLNSPVFTGTVSFANLQFTGHLDFTKQGSVANPSTEVGRLYLKEVNTANNALAVKLQKASNIVEVELTSPGAKCECGSDDGAKDPFYDFQNGTMIVELYCGHSYEMDIPNLRRLS